MNSLVMNDAKNCRSCGIELPKSTPDSRCERCLTSEQLLLSHSPCLPSITIRGSSEPAEEVGTDFGDYVLLSEIARGGMGYVYRARQKSLNRIVALKRPLPGIAADEERVRRFRIEAKAIAALSHPNIIPIFESGDWNGEQFFSMAYVEGEPLSEVIRNNTVLPTQAALYVHKIALAIHHVHQHGVLHRDLKPANIIIDVSDEPRIADFGIAQLLQGNADASDSMAGTPNYMAPEQIQPGTKQVSVATDVYALGGILYNLLTGHPPFDGETRERILWSAYYEEPVPSAQRNPGTPRDLDAVCLKALEKDPDMRYASAQAMAEDLDRFLHHRPVAARPVGFFKKVWMWARRNPFIAGSILVLLAGLVVAVTLQLLAFQKVRSARAASEGFIGFMNKDLAHDLRDVGRLDLMEKVNARAEDYYTNYTALGDDGYWDRRAQFYENTAAVEKDLGELARAESRAAQAEAIYEQQHERKPIEPRWKRNQSHVRMLRLNIAKDSGRHSIAESHGNAAVTLASEALQLAPKDATNRANLANVLLEQASYWIEQKQTEAPTTNIAQAEAILHQLVQLPVVDPEWFVYLANCAYYRGLVRQLRGDLAGALADFTNYLGMMQALISRFPQTIRWQFELTVAYSRVGETLFRMNEFASAQPYLNAFELSARNLSQMDTRNAAWLALYGQSLAWQGYISRSLNPSGTPARDYLQTALVIQSNLVYRNPDWDRWVDAAARTTLELARWYESQGNRELAIALRGRWRQQCQERAVNHPDHVGHQRRWGDAVVSEAELVGRLENRERTIALLQESLEQFGSFSPERPAVLAKARVLARLANAFDAIGDVVGAATNLQRALELRLGLFEQSPHLAVVRQQIPGNFRFVVAYLVKSGDMDQAAAMAEQGLNWASRHLSREESRADFAEMCWQITQAANGLDPALTANAKRIVNKCLTERLATPPELSTEEQSYAERLQEWLDQHP